MAYVVTGRCIECAYTDCVETCPCDCFYRLSEPAMLVINPEPCIDCGACVSACPVRAIYADVDVPETYRGFIEINASRWGDGDSVIRKSAPLPGALTHEQVRERERRHGLGDIEDPE